MGHFVLVAEPGVYSELCAYQLACGFSSLFPAATLTSPAAMRSWPSVGVEMQCSPDESESGFPDLCFQGIWVRTRTQPGCGVFLKHSRDAVGSECTRIAAPCPLGMVTGRGGSEAPRGAARPAVIMEEAGQ